MLPFQRVVHHEAEFYEGLRCLIDCTLTYLAKRSCDLPPWTQEPFFEDEKIAADEMAQLQQDVQAVEKRLDVFTEAKRMLALAEYDLEAAVPTFLQQHCEIKILRDDVKQEDFWLVNDAGEQLAICEVKSVTKGYKKVFTYKLYGHRDTREKPETFPAVLFVNCNLQANRWAEKGTSIQMPECQIAADHSILIVRIEDLLRLWNMRRLNLLKSAQLLQLFTKNKGWLEVTAANEIKIWPEGKAVQLAP